MKNANNASSIPGGKISSRLAPSPTGFIHLGNAWSFLLAWLFARSAGGEVLLRIDDIDPARSKKEYEKALMEDLAWLGLDWDRSARQSERLHLYEAALKKLQDADLVFPCFCTRKELRQLANAPHPGDEGAPYSGACRNLTPAQIMANSAAGKASCLRFKYPDEAIFFEDVIQGSRVYAATNAGGDFALRRSDGVVSYQLACAVDDGLEKMGLVCRGRDLLASAARQKALCKALGLPAPLYAHHGLLLDEEGERLAKRHAALSIRGLRERGVKPQEVIGELGRLAGCNPAGTPKTPAQLIKPFRPDKVPANDVRLPERLARSIGV